MDPVALVATLGVALTAVVVAVAAIANGRRHQALQAWAVQRGWRYLDRRNTELTRALRGGPFGTGGSRHADEVLEGEYAGRPARSFRYTYVTRHTDGQGRTSRTSHRFHVVSLGLPAPLPRIELTPENALTRVANALGARDIDLEHEDFNRAWRVQGPPEQVTYDVLHPRLMERLMAKELRGQRLLIEGDAIFWWDRGSPDLAAVEPALARLTAVVELVPSFVWDNFGGRHA